MHRFLSFEVTGIAGNNTGEEVRVGRDGDGKIVYVGIVIDAQPLDGRGCVACEWERMSTQQRVIVSEVSMSLVGVSVPTLQRIDFIELHSAELSGNERFEKFRLVDRADVFESEAMTVFVGHRIDEADRIVGGVLEPVVIGIEDHVPVVGKVIVGERLSVAIDPVTANPNVPTNSASPRIKSRHTASVVVGLIDIRDACLSTDRIEDLFEQKEPWLVLGGALVSAVDFHQAGPKIAVIIAVANGCIAGDRSAVGNDGQVPRTVVDALCDDLNTSLALTELHKLAASGDSSEASKDARTMALLAHILGIFTSFVVPLIIWLIKDLTPNHKG